MAAAQPTGVVTMLFSDIEGSTRLLDRIGTGRYGEALDLHRRLMRAAFETHDGYEVDYEGDSFFIAFGQAAAAVAAAAEAQRALAAAPWQEGAEIRVRMGLHTGEPVAAPPKYVGLDIHTAARIMAAAHGGQVLLSRATAEQVSAALGDGVGLRDLGSFRLKDLAEPQQLYQLAIDGLRRDFPPVKSLELSDAMRSFVSRPVAERLEQTGVRLPDERRLITVVVAELAGLARDELDPEELLDIVDPVLAALSGVVGRHGGHVERLSGETLLAVFGAPITHEDDAARALRVAGELHEALAGVREQLPADARQVRLRVGVSSGHGIARMLGSDARIDYGVLGEAVTSAQQLAASAPVGETLVGAATCRLAEASFEFGRQEASARLLVGERSGGSATAPADLAGRGGELAQLSRWLDDLTRGTVIGVWGEAGIGKSRLLAELEAEVAPRGVHWLRAQAAAAGAGVAYLPFAELVRQGGVQQRDEAFALLLGLPAPGLEDLEPEAARRRVHDAVGTWLLALADEQPVVLVVDDIHWADASSRALITDLTVLTQQAPVALVLSGRPEARALLGELPLHELHLIALADAEIGDLVATVLGGEAPPELALFVAARSGGNPFFAQELVRSLQERDALAHQQGAWRMRPGWDERTLPLTVENVLSARIDLLPPALADVLQTAAVVGRVARLSLLREVAQVQLDDSVAGLCEHGLLLETLDRAEPAVAFPHALVQDAAYSRLLRKRRRELHLRVAEVSERLYGSGDDVVDLLARHLYLGAAGTKAVELLRRAAARAARLFANDEAILHLKRALELDPDDVSIRLDLADLHELVGAYDDALDLFESARGGSQDVRAWRGIAAILRKRGDYERSLASVDVALRVDALAGEDLTPLWLEQGWTLSVLGRLDEARDVLERALIASDGARTRVVAQTLLQLARAETVAGRYEVALERAFEARSIFAEVDDVPGLATTSRILGDTLRRLDRLDEAAAELRAGLEAAERTGSVEEIGGCLINLALVEHQRGAFEEAVACDHRAIAEFERSGHASGRAQGYANLAWKLAGTGAADEATVYCEKALELAHALGLSLTVADVYDTMASIALGTGDAAAAGARAEEAASLYLQVGAVPQAAGSLELAAQAWEVAGETDRAGGARARLGELAAGSVSPV